MDVELDPLGMFLQSHWIIKLVIMLLVWLSVWCWGIIIQKTFLYREVGRKIRIFEELYTSEMSTQEILERTRESIDPLSRIFRAIMEEWQRLHKIKKESGIEIDGRHLENIMDIVKSSEVGKLQSRLIVLATVSSAAPFIGLFGTVWGIINSFTSIAISKETSLAVVAPGIAEALFATALGLVAAIPATIAYNAFVRVTETIDEKIDRLCKNMSSTFTAK